MTDRDGTDRADPIIAQYRARAVDGTGILKKNRRACRNTEKQNILQAAGGRKGRLSSVAKVAA
ncbi:MAG: hypothetical protein KIT85_17550 [Pseudolabrys sp.]|nr:hypothetical protein [Pseudolabrys sp.]